MNNKANHYTVLLTLILMVSNTVFGQTIFSKKGLISQDNRCNDIFISDTGYVTIGIDADNINGSFCLLFASFDLQGNLQFKKTYCDTINQYFINAPNSAIKTQIHIGYAYCASVTDTADELVSDNSDVLLVKYRPNGDTSFIKRYNFGLFDVGYSVIETSDGGFLLCGTSETNTNPYTTCGRLIKTDSLGNIDWTDTYNCDYISYFSTISQLNTGSFIVGGQRQQGNQFSFQQTQVVKIDNQGNHKWTKLLGGPFDEYTPALTTLLDGNILSAGIYTTEQANPGDNLKCKSYIVKLDSLDGHVIWDKKIGENENITTPVTCFERQDGTIIVGGSTYGWIDESIFDSRKMGFLMSVSAVGDSMWFRKYFLDTANVSIGVIYSAKAESNNIVACGRLNYIGPNSDTWLIKTDANGCLDLSCINGVEELENDDFSLSIYPNPAKDYVSIDLPILYNNGALQVYNMQGQLVKTASITTGGIQTFNISDLPNGIYQLIVHSSNKLFVREKLVVKR